MTNQDAISYFEHDIENLKEQGTYYNNPDEYDTAIDADLIAIENTVYRVPAVPVKIRTSGFFKCPICNKVLNLYEGNYCSNCGQALEWEVLNVQGG